MQIQIVLEKSSLYLVVNTFLPLQNASCTCCLPISCLIYLICVSTLVGLLYVCPCASRLCNCILRGLFVSKYLYSFPWGWDWLYVLATSSLPPLLPPVQVCGFGTFSFSLDFNTLVISTIQFWMYNWFLVTTFFLIYFGLPLLLRTYLSLH